MPRWRRVGAFSGPPPPPGLGGPDPPLPRLEEQRMPSNRLISALTGSFWINLGDDPIANQRFLSIPALLTRSKQHKTKLFELCYGTHNLGARIYAAVLPASEPSPHVVQAYQAPKSQDCGRSSRAGGIGQWCRRTGRRHTTEHTNMPKNSDVFRLHVIQ